MRPCTIDLLGGPLDRRDLGSPPACVHKNDHAHDRTFHDSRARAPCLLLSAHMAPFAGARGASLLVVPLLWLLVCAQPAAAFVWAVGGCCGVACTSMGAAMTAGTGGAAILLEAAEIATCTAECVATGGFCGWLVPPIPPFPCCAWAWLLPF